MGCTDIQRVANNLAEQLHIRQRIHTSVAALNSARVRTTILLVYVYPHIDMHISMSLYMERSMYTVHDALHTCMSLCVHGSPRKFLKHKNCFNFPSTTSSR
jgi:hypothetical protein